MLLRFAVSNCAALTLIACTANDVSPDVAALRVNADARSTVELERVVSSALGGVDVTIANDALTRESTLIIERGMRRSIERPPELGRNLGRPDHFQLVVDARRCFLVHRETGLRWMLLDTECAAK